MMTVAVWRTVQMPPCVALRWPSRGVLGDGAAPWPRSGRAWTAALLCQLYLTASSHPSPPPVSSLSLRHQSGKCARLTLSKPSELSRR